MSATTTQLLSSGEFCKLRYDTIPVEGATVSISICTNNSKSLEFLVLTLLSQMSDIVVERLLNICCTVFFISNTLNKYCSALLINDPLDIHYT